jgi:hypothetical protein
VLKRANSDSISTADQRGLFVIQGVESFLQPKAFGEEQLILGLLRLQKSYLLMHQLSEFLCESIALSPLHMSAIHWQNVNKESSLHKNELECFSLLTQISSSNLALFLFEEKMSALNLNPLLDKT